MFSAYIPKAVDTEKQKALDNCLFEMTAHGCTKVMQVLLKEGANINHKSEFKSDKVKGLKTPLIVATLRQDHETMQVLLENYADCNAATEHGATPLIIAAFLGDLIAVRTLALFREKLWGYKDINFKCSLHGKSALAYAATQGHTEVVNELLNLGASVMTKSNDGKTPLEYALENGHEKTAEILKANVAACVATNNDLFNAAAQNKTEIIVNLIKHHHANINCMIQPDKEVCLAPISPLMMAAYNGHAHAVKILLTYGASPELLTEGNSNALHFAACNPSDNVETIKLLLDNVGRNSNKCIDYVNSKNRQGLTALMFAAERNSTEIIHELVNSRANINEVENSKSTALHCAARYNQLLSITTLLKLGANHELKNDDGNTPIMLAARFGSLSGVKILRDHGANCNTTNKYNDGLLHLAAMNGNTQVIAYLLQHTSINIEAQGYEQRSPLLQAVVSKQNEAVRFLIEAGANKTARSISGETLLILAIKDKNIDLVSYLLNHVKVPINDVDNLGCTALMHAISKIRRDEENEEIFNIIKIILSFSPDLSIRDTIGYSALHNAILCQNAKLVSMLIDAGANPTQLTNYQNGVQYTPLQIAKENGRNEQSDLISAILISAVEVYNAAAKNSIEPVKANKEPSEPPIPSSLQNNSVFAKSPAEVKIPEEFYCPLSMEIMRDPVVFTLNGNTYDREQLELCFTHRNTGPFRESLAGHDRKSLMVPNLLVKSLMASFFEEHPHLNPNNNSNNTNTMVKK